MLSIISLGSPVAFAQGPELDPIDAAVVSVQDDPAARAALEQELLDKVLAEDTPFQERYRAFRVLAVIASDESVAPLTLLLTDSERGHLARNVLEKLPYEDVDWSLVYALPRTSGNMRLGIISSLSYRRSAEAVEPLAALLTHEDLETARAAALALGRIGNLAALEKLYLFNLTSERDELSRDIAEATLAAADRLVEHGNIAPAITVYQVLMDHEWPDFVRSGALVGLLNALPNRAPSIVYDMIHGDDELFSIVAIAQVSTLRGETLTERLAADMDNLPAGLQALLLDAFGERRDPAALPAVHAAMLSDDADVRMAAMKAASILGDTSSIAPMGGILADAADRQERLAAIESLRRINHPDMNAELIAYMNEVDPEVRSDVMEVLVQRGAEEAIDDIVAQVAYDEARPVAFRALGELVSADHLSMMLEMLTDLEGNVGRNDAINAVVALSNRIAEASAEVTIEEAVYGVLPDGDQVDVTGRIRHMLGQERDSFLASNDLAGDPAPGEVKQLRIDYSIDGVSSSRTVSEGESLSLTVGMSTPVLVEQIAAYLEDAPSSEAQVSLLRVLSRLGGQSAFDVVASYVNHSDEEVHDGAVRALASWPDVLAIGALVDIYENSDDTTHRLLALRGAVRLLRMDTRSVEDTVAYYKQLTENAASNDERMLIISGLSNVAHPDALELVAPYLDDDSVQAEAEIAFRNIAEALELDADQLLEERASNSNNNDEDGFVALFDGETLDGWRGDSRFWRVEDGHIIGETTEDNPTEHNTFLVSDDEYSDFEVKFRYRMDSEEYCNSGIQVRSEEFEEYRVRGYQPDIALTDWITGIHYEEGAGGRGILARRGQRVHFTDDGESEVEQFADENELGEHLHTHDWNEYHVIAEGNSIRTLINGHLMHEIIDDAPEARDSGILAFQVHQGPPMTIRFTDIKIKDLSE